MKKNTITYLLLLTFIFLPAGASAIEVQGSASAEVKVGGSVENTEGDPNQAVISGNVSNSESSDKSAPMLLESSVKGKVGATSSDVSTVNGKNDENSSNWIGTSQFITVDRGAIQGWDPDKKAEFLGQVKTHAEIQSEQDLENFAAGILLKDENVESLSLNYKEIKVAYSMPAKFFGIFNSSLNVHVDTDTEGRTKVRYPWYGLFFKKLVNTSELEADVETAIPEISGEAAVDFEYKAKVLQNISGILKTKHDVVVNSTVAVN
jgi:type VI protein secretion system component Hcp